MFKDNRYINAGTNEIYRYGKKHRPRSRNIQFRTLRDFTQSRLTQANTGRLERRKVSLENTSAGRTTSFRSTDTASHMLRLTQRRESRLLRCLRL